jgi:hypothetical protein
MNVYGASCATGCGNCTSTAANSCLSKNKILTYHLKDALGLMPYKQVLA